MTTALEEHVVDRTGWPAGPWDREPDRVEWRHAGLPCLLLRGDVGGWCGYVAVPPGHPDHGANPDAVHALVHGGLCYGAPCSGHICHVPREDEPDNVWWFGFDAMHGGDLIPFFARVFAGLPFRGEPIAYRDVAYMTAEVNELAEQLRARAP